MINFLHTFRPQPELFSVGPLTIYWYGFFIVLGILGALILSLKLAKKNGVEKETIFDLSFWLIIWGIIGARIYDVFLELPYYLQHPWQILKIWQGGLAIHGAIIAGILVIIYFTKKHKLSFWKLSALLVPGLALGQALGRFGNYFNQELFGLPTKLPWGIPIDLLHRPAEYIAQPYFHPTFLYESIGSILIFLILVWITTNKRLKQKNSQYILVTLSYMILYSILRFGLEFIRIDKTPLCFGLRFPQIISLIVIAISLIILIYQVHVRNKNSK